MECFWSNVLKFFKVFLSYIIALARLVIWTVILFFLGLQRTLFMRSEVVGVDFRIMPLRCDLEDVDDKLAYLDKLCIENPEIVGIEDDIPFDDSVEYDFDKTDDNEGFDDIIDDEDFDDGEDL